MASAMRVFRKFRSSDGRIKIATLSGVSVLIAVVALLVGVLPVFASHSTSAVQPVDLDEGGGSGKCFVETGGLPSAASNEFHINNPTPGTPYTSPDGVITVNVYDTEEGETPAGRLFSFEVTGDFAVFDVIVNGGPKSLHYDYDANGLFASSDEDLHAPAKNRNTLHNLSHINICYDVFVPNVEGTKFHDRDADGTFDSSEEDGLAGWKIAAFAEDGTLVQQTTTQADGSYVLGNLDDATYLICEATNTTGLPDDGDDFSWAWTQSAPLNEDCTASGYEPGGHMITVDSETPLASDVDFGNHRQVSVTCDPDNDVVVTLDGESDEPAASVTFPAGCQSGVGEPYTTSFDLGLSTDADDWDQFVVFGGDPTSTQVLTQTIEWAPEVAMYVDENGVDCAQGTDGCALRVLTTKVLLDLTGPVPDPLPDVTFCHDIDGGNPTATTPQCLDSRTIAEGGDVPEDHIQLTENYKLLGDPGNFR